jgi:hypothetical protein
LKIVSPSRRANLGRSRFMSIATRLAPSPTRGAASRYPGGGMSFRRRDGRLTSMQVDFFALFCFF